MKKNVLVLAFGFLCALTGLGAQSAFSFSSAELITASEIKIMALNLPGDLKKLKITLSPDAQVSKIDQSGIYYILTTAKPLVRGNSYNLTLEDPSTNRQASRVVDTSFLDNEVWNNMYSDKELGYVFNGGKSTFRLFVPRGKSVEVVIFNKYDDPLEKAFKVLPMKADENMVFEAMTDGPLLGKYYGYRITERTAKPKEFLPLIPLDTIFADPYSKAITRNNVYPQKMRTLIIDTSKYDWAGDKPTGLDISRSVILETHIRDLTADPTAGTKSPGYKGVVDATRGGLKYLKDLGVNAIEFLPLQAFQTFEPPWKSSTFGQTNNYNVFGRNYWGYMTSNFFAPEPYYGTDGNVDPTKWSGTEGRGPQEMKDMVKALHSSGIAVIMDVVYNHVSNNDESALKIIDMDFYFKKIEKTGTGNELETRRKMARRLVLDSVSYWMKEYHIDGFRFDLATSHDRETSQALFKTIKSINPKAFVIAEPWGGEGATSKEEFIQFGWSVWNDSIRSVIRKENRPVKEGPVFALGNDPKGATGLKPFWTGTAPGEIGQQVNYIESHDDATLGEILRIMSGAYKITGADGKTINRITDLPAYLKLSDRLLKAHRVAAVSLFLAQGPIMMHLGQEWARGKVYPDLTGKVEELTTKGKLGSSSDNVVFQTPTPNSYSADNQVNWINFDHIKLNQDLWDFYAGLIRFRISQPLLGSAKKGQITLIEGSNLQALGVKIADQVYGFVNADPSKEAQFTIPSGTYGVYVDKDKASDKVLREISGGTINVPGGSGLILVKK